MSRRSALRGDAGNAGIVLVLITPALFGVAGLVVDGGRAINARQLAANQAEQAARAGADQLDLDAVRAGEGLRIDPFAARGAAERYLAASGGSGTVAVDSTTVTVTVTTTTRTAFLAVVGINQFRVTGTATGRPARGIDGEETP